MKCGMVLCSVLGGDWSAEHHLGREDRVEDDLARARVTLAKTQTRVANLEKTLKKERARTRRLRKSGKVIILTEI